MKTTLFVTLLFAGTPLFACDTLESNAAPPSKSSGTAQSGKEAPPKGDSKGGNPAPRRLPPRLPAHLFM